MNDKSVYKGPEYPTEAHGSIPAFNSYEEEANFWDTHSITDFIEETEPVKVLQHAVSPQTYRYDLTQKPTTN